MLVRLSLFGLLLVLAGPWPSPLTATCSAAPWDGIVGFLQVVSQLQDHSQNEVAAELHDETVDEEDNVPLRRIVYAVEEQVSADDIRGNQNQSVIVYDSLQDGQNQTDNQADSRIRRSSESSKDATDTGRQSSNSLGARPFLIGRRLWYVPLWFSVYLILYILALTVKSVARHRIKYPTLLAEDDLKRRNGYGKTDTITRRVASAIANAESQYQPQRKWNM